MGPNATVGAMFRRLERVVAEDPPRPDRPEVADHPMRAVTRHIAFDHGTGGWTAERRHKVTALFDGLAPEWHQHLHDPQRTAPLHDAYDRGGVPAGGRCLEVGSGDGANTGFLGEHHDLVVALDLSFEMLVRGTGDRVRADAGALPLADGSIDVAVLVNAFLFPPAIDRVLAPGGVLVWVNTAGDQTPIHLTDDEVESALDGAWEGLGAAAGWGTWSVWRRFAP
jgi:SAM-dependent methyltransferase